MLRGVRWFGLLLLIVTAGCGGSLNAPGGLGIAIASVSAPNARSLLLQQANTQWIVDLDPNAQNPTPVALNITDGKAIFSATFFKNKGATGDEVAFIHTEVAASTTGPTNISLVTLTAIKSIKVIPGQSLLVNDVITPEFSPLAADGKTLVALPRTQVTLASSNTAIFEPIGDNDARGKRNDIAGISQGTAKLTVTSQGVSSAQEDVKVQALFAVIVTAGQVVRVGDPKEITFTVVDPSGQPISLPPGTFTVTIAETTLPKRLSSLGNGQVVGILDGNTTITVTIQHTKTGASKTSAPVGVTILPADPNAKTKVFISPESATVPVIRTLGLTAVVTGTAVTDVDWSVLEGAAGGTIVPGANNTATYTAPAQPGTYRVQAKSQHDPTQTAICTITVRGGSISFDIQ